MLIYVEAELLGDFQMVNLNTANRIYIGETTELKKDDFEKFSHYGKYCLVIEMNDGKLCVYKHGTRKECDKSMKKLRRKIYLFQIPIVSTILRIFIFHTMP